MEFIYGMTFMALTGTVYLFIRHQMDVSAGKCPLCGRPFRATPEGETDGK